MSKYKLHDLQVNSRFRKSLAWSSMHLYQFFINHIWSHVLASSNPHTKVTCANKPNFYTFPYTLLFSLLTIFVDFTSISNLELTKPELCIIQELWGGLGWVMGHVELKCGGFIDKRQLWLSWWLKHIVNHWK